MNPSGADGAGQLPLQQLQPLTHEDQFGVVGDIATGRAQVQDVAYRRTDIAQGMQVGHHIMTQALFVAGHCGKVDIVEMPAQIGQLGRLDTGRDAVICQKPQFSLGFRQGQPEPSPGAVAVLGGEDAHHRRAGIAGHRLSGSGK